MLVIWNVFHHCTHGIQMHHCQNCTTTFNKHVQLLPQIEGAEKWQIPNRLYKPNGWPARSDDSQSRYCIRTSWIMSVLFNFYISSKPWFYTIFFYQFLVVIVVIYSMILQLQYLRGPE